MPRQNTKSTGAAGRRRQRDDARQRARRLHDARASVSRPKASLPSSSHDEVQALVEDARERVRRIEAERRQHRHDFALEVALEPARAARQSSSSRAQQRMPWRASAGSSTSFSSAYCSATSRALRARIACELRVDVHAVGPGCRRAELALLLQARDADLEELVEVGARDAQEAQALEQRHRGSSACASTRRLNSSSDSSRLM